METVQLLLKLGKTLPADEFVDSLIQRKHAKKARATHEALRTLVRI